MLIEACSVLGKVKSIAFGGGLAFLQHAPKTSSASKLEGFPQNSTEVAQTIGGPNVGSMHVQRSDREKDANFTFP